MTKGGRLCLSPDPNCTIDDIGYSILRKVNKGRRGCGKGFITGISHDRKSYYSELRKINKGRGGDSGSALVPWITHEAPANKRKLNEWNVKNNRKRNKPQPFQLRNLFTPNPQRAREKFIEQMRRNVATYNEPVNTSYTGPTNKTISDVVVGRKRLYKPLDEDQRDLMREYGIRNETDVKKVIQKVAFDKSISAQERNILLAELQDLQKVLKLEYEEKGSIPRPPKWRGVSGSTSTVALEKKLEKLSDAIDRLSVKGEVQGDLSFQEREELDKSVRLFEALSRELDTKGYGPSNLIDLSQNLGEGDESFFGFDQGDVLGLSTPQSQRFQSLTPVEKQKALVSVYREPYKDQTRRELERKEEQKELQINQLMLQLDELNKLIDNEDDDEQLQTLVNRRNNIEGDILTLRGVSPMRTRSNKIIAYNK
jgi:hypothetical protein